MEEEEVRTEVRVHSVRSQLCNGSSHERPVREAGLPGVRTVPVRQAVVRGRSSVGETIFSSPSGRE